MFCEDYFLRAVRLTAFLAALRGAAFLAALRGAAFLAALRGAAFLAALRGAAFLAGFLKVRFSAFFAALRGAAFLADALRAVFFATATLPPVSCDLYALQSSCSTTLTEQTEKNKDIRVNDLCRVAGVLAKCDFGIVKMHVENFRKTFNFAS
jgi:hypothetical protein